MLNHDRPRSASEPLKNVETRQRLFFDSGRVSCDTDAVADVEIVVLLVVDVQRLCCAARSCRSGGGGPDRRARRPRSCPYLHRTRRGPRGPCDRRSVAASVVSVIGRQLSYASSSASAAAISRARSSVLACGRLRFFTCLMRAELSSWPVTNWNRRLNSSSLVSSSSFSTRSVSLDLGDCSCLRH